MQANLQRIRRHWGLLGALASFSFTNYVLRTNISVAAKFIMPELHITQAGIGQVFGAFMLGYAIFQIPAGLLGDRFGPRRVLTIACLIWSAATILTGAAPAVVFASSAGALLWLMAVRFVLGAAEAATYPVATRAIASWVPADSRAFANSVLTTGMAVASACTPPVIAWVMVRRGWRECFYLSALLPLALGLLWWQWAGRFQRRFAAPQARDEDFASWRELLRHRDVALLSVSYFLESYVQYIFLLWFYLYLVDVRKFTIVNSGFLTSLPYLVAMVSMPVAGYASDHLGLVWGKLRARQAVVISGFSLAAAFLLFGAGSDNAYVAVASISLSVGLVLSTEGPFWSTSNDVSGGHAGAAGGIMNTAGNFAGVASSSGVPLIVAAFGWAGVFVSSAVLCVVAGALWLAIRLPGAGRSNEIGVRWDGEEDLQCQ